MFEFRIIMSRLHTYFNVKTNKEVAEKLGIDYNTIKGWGSRKKVAISNIIELLKDEGISLTWLVHGKGNMRTGKDDDVLSALAKLELKMGKEIDPKIIEQISRDEQLQELLSLLSYAPDDFIEQIIQRLKEFKKLSNI